MTDRLTLQEILTQIRQNWPQADRPETALILGVLRLSDIVNEETRKVVAGFGLTMAAFEVLTTLRAQPEPRRLSPTELYRSIMISSGGMTKVLKQLEFDGLIEREDNPDDQRSKLVLLTELGRVRTEELMAAVGEQDRKLMGQSLSPEQVRQLGQVLLQTVESLESREL